MSGVIEAGPRRCPTCRRVVMVLYDHAARWAFCPACGATVAPRDQTLTAKDKQGLLRVGLKRLDTDGYLPGPYRSEKEMGRDG